MTLIPRSQMDRILAAQSPVDARIFSFALDGRTVWVKRGGKDYLNPLQRLIGTLTNGPLHRLCPVRIRLYREVARIRTLARSGACVPTIIAIGRDYIVLSDIGLSLEIALRQADSDTAIAYTTRAASALAELHARGQWHGNAKLRNFTYQSGTIGLIDFEDPVSPFPFSYKRTKDVFMLCGSSYRFDRSGALIHHILRGYRRRYRLGTVYYAALFLLPLYLLFRPIARYSGRDVQEIFATLEGIYRFMRQGHSHMA